MECEWCNEDVKEMCEECGGCKRKNGCCEC